MQTISGIMVDGVGDGDIVGAVAKSEKELDESYAHHLARNDNCDLFVVNAVDYSEEFVGKRPECKNNCQGRDACSDCPPERLEPKWEHVNKKGYTKRYKAYAIYGNYLVKTTIFENHLFWMWRKGKKFVWANKKPYILSGDLHKKKYINKRII